MGPQPLLSHHLDGRVATGRPTFMAKSRLPAGARKFALDTDHCYFFGRGYVEDLMLPRISVEGTCDRVWIECEFAPNPFKHDTGLGSNT